MAITAINLARVSFNQRAYNLLEALRTNQAGLYRSQNALSTGLRFMQPSEDPLRSAAAADIERRMERLDQVQANLRSVNSVLSEVESAMQEAIDLFEEARSLAIQAISDGTTSEEREALVVIVNSIIDQLISVGNRQYLNTYLFSGHQATSPFELGQSGVNYSGDANRMETIVDDDLSNSFFTVPGMEFFRAVTAEVRGYVDLNPALTPDTRIGTLRGATGRGVELGRIVVTTGQTRTEIDLSGAATVGDLIDRLNAELPPDMASELNSQGITLRQATTQTVTIENVGGGRAATDLGLAGSFNTLVRDGADLDPRLTPLTRVSELRAGAGIDVSASFVIRNGSQSATIDLSQAETIEDVLNAINHAGVGAWARIAEDGRSIDVIGRVSGINLTIEEAGGLTATNLGIRSLHANTTLSDLNDGLGLRTVDGNDVRITTANGTVIDVDLDGLTTLQDVLDALNTAGGGAIAASLATHGNGIVITDQTIGLGTISIEALNDSPAYRDLGLDVRAVGNQLIGQDVNPLRADSPFTALLELRDGMQLDDRLLMQAAGQRIERVLPEMQRVQGQLAAQARVMLDRTERVDTEATSAQILLSDVRDVDFTDATIRFQQFQTALQANLITASKVMNLSLLDFLR